MLSLIGHSESLPNHLEQFDFRVLNAALIESKRSLNLEPIAHGLVMWIALCIETLQGMEPLPRLKGCETVSDLILRV